MFWFYFDHDLGINSHYMISILDIMWPNMGFIPTQRGIRLLDIDIWIIAVSFIKSIVNDVDNHNLGFDG